MKSQFKRQFPALLLAALAAVAAIGLTLWQIAPPATPGVDLADIPYYQLPFGPDAQGRARPFWPSRLQTADGRMADPARIQSAAQCATCHMKEFEEWAPSLHAIAGRDNVYELTVEANEDLRRDGVERGRFCEGCHAPAEVLAGRTNRVGSVMPSDAETEGLTCVVCHTAVHADPVVGNGALTLAVNTGSDQLSDALILAAPRDHARAFGGADTNALIASPDFCGGCHTETYDPSMSKVEGEQHIQTTWAEWKDSWYDRNDVTCQDCHMAPDPAAHVMALRQGKVAKPTRYTHNFVGANYLMFETALGSNLTFLRGGILPGLTDARNTELIVAQREATHALLRAAAGLELRGTRATGDGLHLEIAVQNLGAGHNLPTGVTDQKHMWLEVVLRDASGAEVYHSGWFDALIGETDSEAAAWMEKFLDADGNRIRDHLTFQTAATAFERMPVPPKGEDVVGYDIPLPADVQGPLRLEARLWYRAALQDLVYNIVKLDLVVPPFELVALQATIPLPPAAEPRP